MTVTEIVAIVTAVLMSNGLWAFFAKVYEKKTDSKKDEIEDLRKQLKENVDILEASITAISEVVKKTNELALATARDRLNFLSQKYLAQGYIPKEYVIAYKILGKAYEKNDGNTAVAEEFETCIKELPIK